MKLCFESTRTTWKVRYTSIVSLAISAFLSFPLVREDAVARSNKVALLIDLQYEKTRAVLAKGTTSEQAICTVEDTLDIADILRYQSQPRISGLRTGYPGSPIEIPISQSHDDICF